MHFSLYTRLFSLNAAAPLFAYIPKSTAETDRIAGQSLVNLISVVADGSLKKELAAQGVEQSCTSSNFAVRREYSTLLNEEKLAYTNAVKCLMSSPSKISAGVAPGAKSRYDDFDPINSPYLDGSQYSQGGNGIWLPHNCSRPGSLLAPCISPVVEGQGGGCVETGPYVGIQANISSVDCWFDYPNVAAGPYLGYQPRCMRRDILSAFTQLYATDASLLDVLTNDTYNTIGPFQDQLQAPTGLHSVGHFTYGGDPGGDIYTSPNDPMFWLHHSMVDRTWWIWQNQEPLERAFQIAGTRTMMNSPPSENATIQDILDLGFVTPKDSPTYAIKNHISSVSGPYCYIYL